MQLEVIYNEYLSDFVCIIEYHIAYCRIDFIEENVF